MYQNPAPHRQEKKNNNVAPWQICLRENIQADTLKNSPEAPPENTWDTTPEWAPVWAGGAGTIPENKNWTWQELEETELLIRSGSHQPHEVAILLGRKGNQISRFLCQLEGIEKRPSPEWIPTWAKCFAEPGDWPPEDIKALAHYWKLDILAPSDIAKLLGKPLEETEVMAAQLNLAEKAQSEHTSWCGVDWGFLPDGERDPKHLDSTTQHMVAEASATRFSLLYETLDQMDHSCAAYKKILHELDQIVRLHTRIFEKFVSVKSRKYNQCSPSPVLAQEDLEQAGKTAIFECLRRWHPDRNIRFSRGAVCIAITREMIAWLESQRLIGLPDKIRAVARKLKAANDRGNGRAEYDRLVKEAGARCVREADKHQNTYAYVTTVPLVDTYTAEEGGESGTLSAGLLKCMNGFETSHQAETDIDLSELISGAAKHLAAPEKRAVLAYFGLTPTGEHIAPKTLEEIGALEGVTKERVRQRISKGKEKMKRYLEAKNVHCLSDALTAG